MLQPPDHLIPILAFPERVLDYLRTHEGVIQFVVPESLKLENPERLLFSGLPTQGYLDGVKTGDWQGNVIKCDPNSLDPSGRVKVRMNKEDGIIAISGFTSYTDAQGFTANGFLYGRIVVANGVLE